MPKSGILDIHGRFKPISRGHVEKAAFNIGMTNRPNRDEMKEFYSYEGHSINTINIHDNSSLKKVVLEKNRLGVINFQRCGIEEIYLYGRSINNLRIMDCPHLKKVHFPYRICGPLRLDVSIYENFFKGEDFIFETKGGLLNPHIKFEIFY